MSSLESRLKLAFDPKRHKAADLARAAHVKQPSVADWFSGKTRSLRAEPLVRAAIYLDVHPLWLAAGEGPMRGLALSGSPRPAWPFPGLEETTICALDRDTLLRLEGAMVATAAAFGARRLAKRRAA
jgi:transcriptional regulator with XRE-family HTH domain